MAEKKTRRGPEDTVTVKLPRRVHVRIKRWAVDLDITLPEVIERAMNCLDQYMKTRGEEEDTQT